MCIIAARKRFLEGVIKTVWRRTVQLDCVLWKCWLHCSGLNFMRVKNLMMTMNITFLPLNETK